MHFISDSSIYWLFWNSLKFVFMVWPNMQSNNVTLYSFIFILISSVHFGHIIPFDLTIFSLTDKFIFFLSLSELFTTSLKDNSK